MISNEALFLFGWFVKVSFRCKTIPYDWDPVHTRLVTITAKDDRRGYIQWHVTIFLFSWAPCLLLAYKFMEDCVDPPSETGTSSLNFLSVYFYNICSLFFSSCVHYVVLRQTKEIETFVNGLIRLDKQLQVKLLANEDKNWSQFASRHDAVPLHVIFKVIAWFSYLSAIPAALDIINPNNIVYKYIIMWIFGRTMSPLVLVPAIAFCFMMIVSMINILVLAVTIEFLYIASTFFWIRRLLREMITLADGTGQCRRPHARAHRLCRIYRRMQVMNGRFNSYAQSIIMPSQQFTLSTLYVISFTFLIKTLQHTDEIPVAMIGQYTVMPMMAALVVLVQILFFGPTEQIQFFSKIFVSGLQLKGHLGHSKYLRRMLRSCWTLRIHVSDYFYIRRGAFLAFVATGLSYGIQTILV